MVKAINPNRIFVRLGFLCYQALAVQSAPIKRVGVSTATYFLALI